MKKEFKFVRGLYTDKPLFDDTIKEESLFILNQKGEEMGFEDKDDEPTQKKLLNASSSVERERKLYTITPEQITMEGNLVRGENNNSYSFTSTVKDTCVSDSTESVPQNVKNKAKTLIEGCLFTSYNLGVDNIGIAEDKDPINIDFSYNDKPFTKSMRFKVTGKVRKLSFGILDGVLTEDATVYAFNKENGNYNICESLTGSYFSNGVKYIEAESDTYTTVLKTLEIDVNELATNEYTPECVAENYALPEGYYFKSFNDNLTHLLEVQQDNDKRDYYIYNPNNVMICKVRLPLECDNHLREGSVTESMYIVNDDRSLQKLEQYFPNKTTTLKVYTITDDITSYEIYNDTVYEKDSGDSIYKKLEKDQMVPLNKNLVYMSSPTVLSPKYGENYIIEIVPDKVFITATEV